MFTIFTLPKAFDNKHINTIQRNAISSWKQLERKNHCEIILLGDETGIIETAREYKVKYFTQINKNEFNTPLLNSAFSIIKEKAKYDILMYVNCDIILFPELLDTIKIVSDSFKKFLVVGQRWNLNIDYKINYNKSDWVAMLKKKIIAEGELYPPEGSDYFIFRKNSIATMPSFAVGRVCWDNWMIYEARRRKIAAIDASGEITAIHQNHSYGSSVGYGKEINTNQEANKNRELAGGQKNIFVLKDCNWEIINGKLTKRKHDWSRMFDYLFYTPEVLIGSVFFWKLLIFPAKFMIVVKKFLRNLYANYRDKEKI